MFVLRRVAAKTIVQQPLRQLSTYRATCRVTISPSIVRSFHQSRVWGVEEVQKKSNETEGSPAEAPTSGIKIDSETAPEHAAKGEVNAKEGIKEELITEEQIPTAHDASVQTASEATSQQETVTGKVQGVAAAVQSAASSVSQAAQDAFGSSAHQESSRKPRFGNSRDKPPSRILYVGNLFFEVTAPQLEAEFARFGEITNSRIVTDTRGLSKGFGYIEFASLDAAETAIRELDQKVFHGRRMAVQYHQRRTVNPDTSSREKNPPSKTLFIGNMSYEMSDRDLNDLFREIRNVLDVRVAIDRRSGQPRGFAHADFIDIASAETAKAYLENKVIYGRQLRVDFSRPSVRTSQVVDGQ